MLKQIKICDRCGKELKNSDKTDYLFLEQYRFELCEECFKEIQLKKEKYDMEFKKLINKKNKLEEDFLKEIKTFYNEKIEKNKLDHKVVE